MPVANPCCCSLRTGTQVVAIVNIVLSSIMVLFLFLGVFGLGVLAAVGSEKLSKHNSNADSEYETNIYSDSGKSSEDYKKVDTAVMVFFIFSIIMLLVSIFELISSIVLLIGANTRHHGKCRFWYIVTFVFLVLYTLKSLFEIIAGGINGGFGTAVYYFVTFLIGFGITGYQLWVVYAFMEELKTGGSSLPTTGAGYVHGGGAAPQAYIFNKPTAGPGQMPPPYSQTQEGYVAVPLNNPQGPGYPPAMPYPQQQGGFYPNLAEAEKGHY